MNSLLWELLTIRFSDVFRGYRSGTLVENGLIMSQVLQACNFIKTDAPEQVIFCAFREIYWNTAQSPFTCSKSAMGRAKQDVVLVSLLLTLNRFHILP